MEVPLVMRIVLLHLPELAALGVLAHAPPLLTGRQKFLQRQRALRGRQAGVNVHGVEGAKSGRHLTEGVEGISTEARDIKAVLWIRIRIDPELLPGSGSGIKVPDQDPAKSERAYK